MLTLQTVQNFRDLQEAQYLEMAIRAHASGYHDLMYELMRWAERAHLNPLDKFFA